LDLESQRLAAVLHHPRKSATKLFAQRLVRCEKECRDFRSTAHRQHVGEAAEALDEGYPTWEHDCRDSAKVRRPSASPPAA